VKTPSFVWGGGEASREQNALFQAQSAHLGKLAQESEGFFLHAQRIMTRKQRPLQVNRVVAVPFPERRR